MVIMEFAPHGSLLSFLRGKRDTYEANWTKTMNDPDKEFTLVDLAMIGFQISRGMAFLASKKVSDVQLHTRVQWMYISNRTLRTQTPKVRETKNSSS